MQYRTIIIDDDDTQRMLLSELIKETKELLLLQEFNNALSALEFLKNTAVDLIFLDVEMPELSGLEFIDLLREKPYIIIVSSKEKYALKSYEHEVNDYLLKPISFATFLKAVNKVEKFYAKKNVEVADTIFVKANGQIEKLEIKAIDYILAAVDYIEIFSKGKKYLVNSSMNKIMEKLPETNFIRVHRSAIVNLNKIKAIDGSVLLIENQTIPISKGYKDDLMSRINLLN